MPERAEPPSPDGAGLTVHAGRGSVCTIATAPSSGTEPETDVRRLFALLAHALNALGAEILAEAATAS